MRATRSGLAALGLVWIAAPALAQMPPDDTSDAASLNGLVEGVAENVETSATNDGVARSTDLSLSDDARGPAEREFVHPRVGGEPDIDASLEFEHDFSLAALHDVDLSAPVAGHPNLAEAATNPVAALVQFQIQNNFVGRTVGADGYANQLVIQPVIPWKIGDQQFISRITFPLLVATADLGDPIGRKYGTGDTVAINFWNIPIKEGFFKGTFAVGVGLTFPTASSDFLGQGKYQAGPGLFYINTNTKGIQWGGLVYQQWSYASAGGDGSRPEVSELFFQPVFNWHFAPGWYTGLGDILWSIDWNDNDRWSLPLAVRLGHVTKFGHQPVNIFVEPFYNVIGNSTGNKWGVKLSVTLLFPE